MVTDLSIEQLRDLKVKLIGFIRELKRETREIDKEIKERLAKNGGRNSNKKGIV